MARTKLTSRKCTGEKSLRKQRERNKQKDERGGGGGDISRLLKSARMPSGTRLAPAQESRSRRHRVNRTRKTNFGVVPPTPEEISDAALSKVAERHADKRYPSSSDAQARAGATTCHQCRQKTMDTKTVCRSGKCVGVRGQFCGLCLLSRYGQEVRAALRDPQWACPPCAGTCNCSVCRKRQGLQPTGQVFAKAKTKGYSSVKEFLDVKEDKKAAECAEEEGERGLIPPALARS